MNEAPDFVLFLGRFHPLIVHLPIGFLVFAFLLEVLGRRKKFEVATTAIPIALLFGFISALIASILGYMLSLSGDYEAAMLDNHFWFGIFTTAITLIAWLIRIEKIKLKKKVRLKTNISLLTLIVILISVTGHYGGNLTHGSDYLTKYLPFNKKEKKELAKIDNVEDAVIFDYLAQPILNNKCASCHNESKKKGGLSFHDSLAITKGGKSGTTLIAGNSGKSEMIKRVLLNPDHEDFMPPDGKTPLTDEEIAILTYWIDNANADFNTTIASVETPENVMHIASNILGVGEGTHKGKSSLPSVAVIEESILKDIISEGFTIRELVFESNIFEVVLPPYNKNLGTTDLNSKLEKLSKIKDNILWLYIENNDLNDEHLKTISTFKNLQKLVINRNPITDTGIGHITNLQSLSSLNVYDTKITKSSIEILSKLERLKTIYAWRTQISKEDLASFSSELTTKIIITP